MVHAAMIWKVACERQGDFHGACPFKKPGDKEEI
jgi:hypothetical protein